jgi:D-glycero-D-manno-heptose 1,7-bisphosphate phosphatase
VETLNEIHHRLLDEVAKKGGKIEAIYYCPHHPETHYGEGISELRRACKCRKPAPGLIFQAQREHKFELGSAIMVGDRPTDIRAGEAAGIRTVLIGHNTKIDTTFQFPSLLEFAKFITA